MININKRLTDTGLLVRPNDEIEFVHNDLIAAGDDTPFWNIRYTGEEQTIPAGEIVRLDEGDEYRVTEFGITTDMQRLVLFVDDVPVDAGGG
jgi:hypothetical protein